MLGAALDKQTAVMEEDQLLQREANRTGRHPADLEIPETIPEEDGGEKSVDDGTSQQPDQVCHPNMALNIACWFWRSGKSSFISQDHVIKW